MAGKDPDIIVLSSDDDSNDSKPNKTQVGKSSVQLQNLPKNAISKTIISNFKQIQSKTSNAGKAIPNKNIKVGNIVLPGGLSVSSTSSVAVSKMSPKSPAQLIVNKSKQSFIKQLPGNRKPTNSVPNKQVNSTMRRNYGGSSDQITMTAAHSSKELNRNVLNRFPASNADCITSSKISSNLQGSAMRRDSFNCPKKDVSLSRSTKPFFPNTTQKPELKSTLNVSSSVIAALQNKGVSVTSVAGSVDEIMGFDPSQDVSKSSLKKDLIVSKSNPSFAQTSQKNALKISSSQKQEQVVKLCSKPSKGGLMPTNSKRKMEGNPESICKRAKLTSSSDSLFNVKPHQAANASRIENKTKFVNPALVSRDLQIKSVQNNLAPRGKDVIVKSKSKTSAAAMLSSKNEITIQSSNQRQNSFPSSAISKNTLQSSYKDQKVKSNDFAIPLPFNSTVSVTPVINSNKAPSKGDKSFSERLPTVVPLPFNSSSIKQAVKSDKTSFKGPRVHDRLSSAGSTQPKKPSLDQKMKSKDSIIPLPFNSSLSVKPVINIDKAPSKDYKNNLKMLPAVNPLPLNSVSIKQVIKSDKAPLKAKICDRTPAVTSRPKPPSLDQKMKSDDYILPTPFDSSFFFKPDIISDQDTVNKDESYGKVLPAVITHPKPAPQVQKISGDFALKNAVLTNNRSDGKHKAVAPSLSNVRETIQVLDKHVSGRPIASASIYSTAPKETISWSLVLKNKNLSASPLDKAKFLSSDTSRANAKAGMRVSHIVGNTVKKLSKTSPVRRNTSKAKSSKTLAKVPERVQSLNMQYSSKIISYKLSDALNEAQHWPKLSVSVEKLPLSSSFSETVELSASAEETVSLSEEETHLTLMDPNQPIPSNDDALKTDPLNKTAVLSGKETDDSSVSQVIAIAINLVQESDSASNESSEPIKKCEFGSHPEITMKTVNESKLLNHPAHDPCEAISGEVCDTVNGKSPANDIIVINNNTHEEANIPSEPLQRGHSDKDCMTENQELSEIKALPIQIDVNSVEVLPQNARETVVENVINDIILRLEEKSVSVDSILQNGNYEEVPIEMESSENQLVDEHSSLQPSLASADHAVISPTSVELSPNKLPKESAISELGNDELELSVLDMNVEASSCMDLEGSIPCGERQNGQITSPKLSLKRQRTEESPENTSFGTGNNSNIAESASKKLKLEFPIDSSRCSGQECLFPALSTDVPSDKIANDNRKNFKKLLTFSKSLMVDSSAKEKEIICRKLLNCLNSAQSSFVNSAKFTELLDETWNKLEKNADVFISLLHVQKTLKQFKMCNLNPSKLESGGDDSNITLSAFYSGDSNDDRKKITSSVSAAFSSLNGSSTVFPTAPVTFDNASLPSVPILKKDFSNCCIPSGIQATRKNEDIQICTENELSRNKSESNNGESANCEDAVDVSNSEKEILPCIEALTHSEDYSHQIDPVERTSSPSLLAELNSPGSYHDTVCEISLNSPLAVPSTSRQPDCNIEVVSCVSLSSNFDESSLPKKAGKKMNEEPQAIPSTSKQDFFLSSLNLKPSTSFASQPLEENSMEPLEPVFDSRTASSINILETRCRKLMKKIKKLEKAEMTLDDLDAENSAYLLEARYKKRYMEVFRKLCQLQKVPVRTGRCIEKKFVLQESRFRQINEAVQKLINKRKTEDKFPDFAEVHKIVKDLSEDIGLDERTVDNEARRIFTEVGLKLKRRRLKDTSEALDGFVPGDLNKEDDPAEHHPDIQKKLEENAERFQKSTQEIFDKYAQLQESYVEDDDPEKDDIAVADELPLTDKEDDYKRDNKPAGNGSDSSDCAVIETVPTPEEKTTESNSDSESTIKKPSTGSPFVHMPTKSVDIQEFAIVSDEIVIESDSSSELPDVVQIFNVGKCS